MMPREPLTIEVRSRMRTDAKAAWALARLLLLLGFKLNLLRWWGFVKRRIYFSIDGGPWKPANLEDTTDAD